MEHRFREPTVALRGVLSEFPRKKYGLSQTWLKKAIECVLEGAYAFAQKRDVFSITRFAPKKSEEKTGNPKKLYGNEIFLEKGLDKFGKL